MRLLEHKRYGEQQKITRTTKSISYNMTNTVRSLTRITPSTESNRCYHNIKRYSSIKYSCCRLGPL